MLTFILVLCEMAAVTPVILFRFKDEEGTRYSTFMRETKVSQYRSFSVSLTGIVSQACLAHLAFAALEEEG